MSEGSLWAPISRLCSKDANCLQCLPPASCRTAFDYLLIHPTGSDCAMLMPSSNAVQLPAHLLLASDVNVPAASQEPVGILQEGAGPFPRHQPVCSLPKPSRQPWWVPAFSYLPVWESKSAILLQARDLSAWLPLRALSQIPYDLLIVGTWQGLFKGAWLGWAPAADREKVAGKKAAPCLENEGASAAGPPLAQPCQLHWQCGQPPLPVLRTVSRLWLCLPGFACRVWWGWNRSQFPGRYVCLEE